MRHFTIETTTLAKPERVWQVMAGVDEWHEWTRSITSITRLGGAPFVVGTRVLIRQPKLPPAIWTISEIDPGRSFSWISTVPGLRAIGRHEVHEWHAGSRIVLTLELQGLLGGLWGRLTRKLTEQYIAYESVGLKARSEGHTFRPGAI